MGKITYKLSDFNSTKARQGALVVAITKEYADSEGYNDTVVNIKLKTDTSSPENFEENTKSEGEQSSEWEKNNKQFLGAGVAKEINSRFILIVDSEGYTFNAIGNGIDTDEEGNTLYVLKMGKVESDVMVSGNTVTSNTTSATTRSGDGGQTTDKTEYSDKEGKVTIDYLTPRDQFAIQVLREILSHTKDDPSSMSTGLMATYCEAAYQWANLMLTSAAGTRSTLEDETATDSNESVEVGSLENNTEKLLNNVVAALERTDKKIGSETIPAHWERNGIISDVPISEWWELTPSEKWTAEHEGKTQYECYDDAISDGWKEVPEKTVSSYAERITNPEMNALWTDYVSHTEQPAEGSDDEPVTKKYGLYDLIKAIQDISAGGGGSTEVDFTALIAALQGLSTDRTVSALPDVKISNNGLGGDKDHPLYISGGGFPSRQVLAAAFTEALIHDFLTFNEAGAVGYSTKEEVKKAILGYLNAYADLTALSSAIYTNLSDTIDNRIKAWLEAARDAEGRSLTVNRPT